MAEGNAAQFFSNMFKGGGQQQPQGGQPAPQQQSPMKQGQAVQGQKLNPDQSIRNQVPAATGGGPSDGAPNDDNTQKSESPLDVFSKMFDTNNAGNEENQPPSLNLSSDALNEVSSKMSFTQNLPPEVQEALHNMGDQGKTILGLVEHVGRQAYSNALQHNTALTDRFVGMRSEHDSKKLGDLVRKELVSNSLKSNVNASHPVVASAMTMVADQLQRAYPDATPDWIQKQSQSFFTELSKAMSPEGTESQDTSKDVNWEDWLKTGLGGDSAARQ